MEKIAPGGGCGGMDALDRLVASGKGVWVN